MYCKKIMCQVAGLYYKINLTQEKIAKRLGLSRYMVRRLLKTARKNGIVRIEVTENR